MSSLDNKVLDKQRFIGYSLTIGAKNAHFKQQDLPLAYASQITLFFAVDSLVSSFDLEILHFDSAAHSDFRLVIKQILLSLPHGC